MDSLAYNPGGDRPLEDRILWVLPFGSFRAVEIARRIRRPVADVHLELTRMAERGAAVLVDGRWRAP